MIEGLEGVKRARKARLLAGDGGINIEGVIREEQKKFVSGANCYMNV